jgi:DNA segregation ATPase FtsK/SpoIIIE-like protein
MHWDFTGAAFADLVMQFFGLAGVIGLLPALFWAIGLLRNRPVDRASRRGAAWFGGAWLTAALFGLMPSSHTWPLPNGLGGVLGDMALKLPSVFTGGFPSGIVAALEENARMLESVLDDYGVKGEIVSVRPGPVVTMYELEPAPGLKASPRDRAGR